MFDRLKFCEVCENIMFPRDGKLYCQACDKEFDLERDKVEDYKIIKTIRHDEAEDAPIVIRSIAATRIGAEDRKAFEEYFQSDGDYA